MQGFIDNLERNDAPSEPVLTDERRALVRALVTSSTQPGAYGLFAHAGRVIELQQDERVLLVSPDPIVGALLLVREFGCEVVAVATAPEGPEQGRRRLEAAPERERVRLLAGNIASLQPGNPPYDALITEGAFAASDNKMAAACALFDALRPGGRLALAEPTVYFDLVPDNLRTLFQQVGTLAGARPAPVYRSLLGEQGFTAFVTEERRQDLVRAVEATKQKLLLATVELMDEERSGDMEASARLAEQVLGLIGSGVASYVLISAEKPTL